MSRAAVMMQWDTIPEGASTRAFRYRRCVGRRLQTVTLRGQIARFLHAHKDEPADGISNLI